MLRAAHPTLSEREVEICASLLVGRSYKEIARQRGVLASSVITYRKRAYAKLGIMSRHELELIYDDTHRRALASAA